MNPKQRLRVIPPKGSIPRIMLGISIGGIGNGNSDRVSSRSEKPCFRVYGHNLKLREETLFAEALAEKIAFWQEELRKLREEFSEEELAKLVNSDRVV